MNTTVAEETEMTTDDMTRADEDVIYFTAATERATDNDDSRFVLPPTFTDVEASEVLDAGHKAMHHTISKLSA